MNSEICCVSISQACVKDDDYVCEKCIRYYIDTKQIDLQNFNNSYKSCDIKDIGLVVMFCDNFELFKDLLELYDGDVEVKDICGSSLLSFAISHDKYTYVKYLLEKGANVLFVENNGTTCLHLVRNLKIAELLFEHGAIAHINKEIPTTRATPLYYLVSKNNVFEIVQLFLEKGANPDVCADQPTFGIRGLEILPNIKLTSIARKEYIPLLEKFSKCFG